MGNRQTRKLWLTIITSVVLAGSGYAGEPQDIRSDTWVATDALGRSLPVAEEVGPPRANKFVGVFYFLWLGQAGDAGPFDITKILVQGPDRDPQSAESALGARAFSASLGRVDLRLLRLGR